MTNYVQEGKQIAIAVTHPVSPASGAPVRIGDRCGVAMSVKDANGLTAVLLEGVCTISVKGVDGGGNSAVVAGDTLYYVDADNPPVSKKNTGKKFGTALAGVNAGATAAIDVLLAQ